MASCSAPTLSRRTPPLTRRDRALLAAVKAGRCHLSPRPLPSLLIDGRGACDQLAAHRLLANGLIRPGTDREGRPAPADLTPAELTPAGEAAIRRVDGHG